MGELMTEDETDDDKTYRLKEFKLRYVAMSAGTKRSLPPKDRK